MRAKLSQHTNDEIGEVSYIRVEKKKWGFVYNGSCVLISSNIHFSLLIVVWVNISIYLYMSLKKEYYKKCHINLKIFTVPSETSNHFLRFTKLTFDKWWKKNNKANWQRLLSRMVYWCITRNSHRCTNTSNKTHVRPK